MKKKPLALIAALALMAGAATVSLQALTSTSSAAAMHKTAKLK